VRRIRDELDKLPFYQPLHILGTGNPWSIAVLAAAGADSFDGLEWCRVAVDRDTGRLNHFQHFDFFAYQARLADSPIALAAVDDEGVDWSSPGLMDTIRLMRGECHHAENEEPLPP
jgi:hypothetical protein